MGVEVDDGMVDSVDSDQTLLEQSGPEVIKLFSCSTQLSMKFFLLTIVGMLTYMSGKNSILGLSERKMSQIS